jgi:L-ascorbate oxidase
MQVESRERPTVATSYAVLNYGPKLTEPQYPPIEPPLTLPATDTNWLEYELEPLFDNDFPALEEVTRRVHIDVQQIVNGMTVYRLNNVTWTPSVPQEPYLVSLYKNDGTEYPSMERALENGGVDPVTRAWPAEIGEVLEIVMQNICDGTGKATGGFDTHPFHGHGLHFYDIGSGNGTYDLEENEKRLRGYHPVQRDTTPLFRYLTEGVPGTRMGWRAWRLRIKEPGVWMIHCHIEEHMLMYVLLSEILGFLILRTLN